MKSIAFAALLAVAAIIAPVSAAPELGREELRKFVTDTAPAVITLEVVIDMKITYGGQSQERERKFDAIATVIDEKGLAVSALSRLDPSAMYAQMMGEGDSFSARIKSLKYILPDNTEIPAAVVLRESELDLVFVKPIETPAEKMTYVDFSNSTEPALMDPVFVVARSGLISRRSTLGMSGEIQSFVKLPRRYYIPSAELVSGGAGTPIFSKLDGGLVGLTAIYTFPGGSDAMDSGDEPNMYIILPAEQIHELADDAAAATPEKIAAEEPAEATPAEGEATPAETPASQ
ncbi:hypothetical protein GC173_04605 [bacterium]|nr:hypothetical protein [bacterium]